MSLHSCIHHSIDLLAFLFSTAIIIAMNSCSASYHIANIKVTKMTSESLILHLKLLLEPDRQVGAVLSVSILECNFLGTGTVSSYMSCMAPSTVLLLKK